MAGTRGYNMAETSSSKHDQLRNDYVDLWNGDFSKLDVVSETVAVYDPGAPDGEVHGRDALEALLEDVRTGFPDFQVTVEDTLTSEDLVMGEWTATGTHEGEFNDVPPTEREIDLTGMDKIRVVDGKVQEHRLYYDLQEMFEQLGVAEA